MFIMIAMQWLLFLSFAGFHLRYFGLNIFHPTIFYLFFHFVVFVLHPTMAELFHFNITYNYMRFMPSEETRIRALLVTDVALAAFCLTATYVTRMGRHPGTFPTQRGFPEDVNVALLKRSFLLATGILAPFILISLYYYFTHPLFVQRHFGTAHSIQLTQSIKTGQVLFTNTPSYVWQAAYMTAPLVTAWAFLNHFKIGHCLPFVIYIAIRSYDGAGRFAFVIIALAFGLLYLVSRAKNVVSGRLVLFLAMILVLFGALGQNRLLVKELTGTLNPVEAELKGGASHTKVWADRSYLDGQDFANYEYLSYIVYYVPDASKTYTYFTQYLTVLVRPIPRVIWKDKPERDLIPLVNLNSFGRFDVLTPSIVGDGWVSLGYIGVIVTLSTVAWILGSAYNRFSLGEPSAFYTVTYCIILAFSLQWFRDGGTSIAVFLGVNLFPIWVWWMIHRWLSQGVVAPEATPA
jgi:hypothetical protein